LVVTLIIHILADQVLHIHPTTAENPREVHRAQPHRNRPIVGVVINSGWLLCLLLLGVELRNWDVMLGDVNAVWFYPFIWGDFLNKRHELLDHPGRGVLGVS
jgi:hypothetical protein